MNYPRLAAAVACLGCGVMGAFMVEFVHMGDGFAAALSGAAVVVIAALTGGLID